MDRTQPRRVPHNPAWAEHMSPVMSLRAASRTHDLALEAAGRSLSVRDGYRLAEGRFIDFLEHGGIETPTVGDLAPEAVRAFVLELRVTPTVDARTGYTRKKGPTTIRAHVVALKVLAHFLVEEGVLSADPLGVVKLPKVPKTLVEPFAKDDVRRMLDVIPLRPMATRNRALVYTLLATGLRADELCHLTMDHLNLKEGWLRVTGKGSKERIIPTVDRVTARYLALYLGERPDGPAGKNRVFLTGAGKPMAYEGVYQVVRRIGEDAGVEDVHPHRWRHSFATFWLEAHPGALFHLQALLGHSSLEMVRHYAQLAQATEELEGPSVVDIAMTQRRRG